VSAEPEQTLDSVVDSMGRLFSEEASTVFFESTCEVVEQVRSVPNTDTRKHLETCRELFRTGWLSWLEALSELVYGYGEKFTQIAMSCPALVADDPLKWIRLQLDALLSRELRQELSVKALAEQATQRRRARREAMRNGIASDPAPLESQPGHPRNYSRVGAWFRFVAEDGPDFDLSESGFHEPWLAPAFVDDRLRTKTVGLPDRLTAAQTERAIRHVETLFAYRFDHVLQQVEDKARITLSTNGAVSFTPAHKVQKAVPSSPANQSSPEAHDKNVPASPNTSKVSAVHVTPPRTATARIAVDPVSRHRQACIFATLREGKKGPAYCEALARKKLLVSIKWRALGCPKEYPDAYLKAKWKRLIIQEKSRHAAQLAILERKSPGAVDNLIRTFVPPHPRTTA
jgi:hypothetical protein